MSNETTNYDPKAVLATFNLIPLSGFAEDGIQIEPTDEDVTVTKGIDGALCFNETNIRCVKVTLTFVYGVVSSKIVEAMRQAIRAPGPLAMVDKGNTAIVIGANFRITKAPSVMWQKEVKPIVFELTGNTDAVFLA